MLWEGDLVYQMNLALQVHTNLLLVDLGCRIGVYSVWAAAVGRPVLAAESDPTYITLMQKTIRANGLDSYITLLANSLSDSRQQATGPTQQPVTKRGMDKFLVHSICLDDLTPLVAGIAVYLRMDARYGHPRVFSCASVFFRAVSVKIIQMEWVGHSGANRDLIAEIMTGYGYTMSTRSTVQTVENMKDSKDVFFLRTSS
ncbi:unnamed protein product [Lymnaea stagnalis]|uniref:tRNA(Phe) (4-demethylwyosine(37)-C(7)) aminocarboxypropyltransferase n=1 Tax=Lymnaea stagnalis TaxID=6523 RepID=A0AAV2IBQ6_LYMST